MPLSPKLRELLDACRPDSADLAAPEFRDLAETLEQDEQARQIAERSAAFDRAIRAAQCNIPVPPGLADRILLKLNLPLPAPPQLAELGSIESERADTSRHMSGPPTASTSQCSTYALEAPVLEAPVLKSPELEAQKGAGVESNSSVRPAAPAARVTRRGLMWFLSTSAAIGLLVLVGVRFGLPRQVDPRSADELAEAGVRWAEAAQHWTDLNPDHLLIPADHALSSQVRGYFAGWKAFPAEYDRRAIAFGLRGRIGDAWLFATRSNAPFLAPDSRPERLPTTGGVSVAAWREGPILYVLVCRERQQRLDDYLIPRKLAALARPTHVLAVQTPKNPDNGDEA